MKKNIFLIINVIEIILFLFLLFLFVSSTKQEEKTCPTTRNHICTKEVQQEDRNYTLSEKYEFESDLDGYIQKFSVKYIYTYKTSSDYQKAKSEPKEDRYTVSFNDEKMQVILLDNYIKLGEDKWYISFSDFLKDSGYKCEFIN